MRLKRADFRSGREGGRTDGQMDGQTDKREEEQKSLCVLKDFVPFRAAAQKKKYVMDGWMNGRTDERTKRDVKSRRTRPKSSLMLDTSSEFQ